MRTDGRTGAQLRPVTIEANFLQNPLGSVLISFGNTKVICSVSIEDAIPRWLKGAGHGWLTAEYSMLPCAGCERSPRESTRGKLGGRTHEIQRLIGRSLRSVFDLTKLGERTLWVDCDVIQADGGTRTAAVTGGFIALELAVERLLGNGTLFQTPIKERMAAVSVGVVKNEILLDLCYAEDVIAEVDMNVVMTESGKLIEIQGTAETNPYTKEMCMEMINIAHGGVIQLLNISKEALASL
ncbi:MAG: ribonuclease PH [Candidatus Auribacterota bacterium]|nr:ribonuclease PH [Candidatus Auribacterota bacterium]